MQNKEIEELIHLIEKSQIEEFELERQGTRIRIRKPISGSSPLTKSNSSMEIRDVSSPSTQPEDMEVVTTEIREAPEKTGTSDHIFTAPIVGTFYITPKPDSPPLVEVGNTIHLGKVICIIEAMKIFNQIESDVEGELIQIMVENGQPVEFGEPLFQIRLPSQ